MEPHKISRFELVNLLEATVSRTLKEVDSQNVFKRTINNPKITGIAGDVIEQSVLGYTPNNSQLPDLIVDGVDVEVKTTGLRRSKKNRSALEAKEPMSITAVSPETIVNESFEDSNFWHKAANLLLVYYLYNSDTTVTADKYADFVIQGYQFVNFSKQDREILKNDWQLVQNFIQQSQLTDNPEEHYKLLSSTLRKDLMFIDTAPKWPKRPRFRLKRSVVSYLAQQKLGKKFEPLQANIDSYHDIDKILHDLTEKYQGLTINELAEKLNFPEPKDGFSKQIGEQILVRMLGGSAKKMSKIDLFAKLALIPKTIIQTPTQQGAEDTKLGRINFDDWLDSSKTFEESEAFEYFSNNTLLFMIFQKPQNNSPVKDAIFKGFKRAVFSEEFIYSQVQPVWNRVRELVWNDNLVDEIVYQKNGKPKINKTGVISSAPNFPKSAEGDVFVRGTGKDSTKKTFSLNGVDMYVQYVWAHKHHIKLMLEHETFI